MPPTWAHGSRRRLGPCRMLRRVMRQVGEARHRADVAGLVPVMRMMRQVGEARHRADVAGLVPMMRLMRHFRKLGERGLSATDVTENTTWEWIS